MTNQDRNLEDGTRDDAWLTVYEVAGQFLARPETVKSWIRDGMLKAEDRGRLGFRIARQELEEFIVQHFQAEGFRSADHSFSSGVGEDVLTATAIPEQSVERQGAGWPFRRDDPAAGREVP